MAAEMVFGAIISFAVESLLNKITSSDVVGNLRGKKDSGFDDLLEKMEMTFYRLAEVLADAGKKQIRNRRVEKWLDRLQDAVDDAEDLFDEIEYDALKPKEAESRTGKRKLSELYSTISNVFNSTDLEMKTKMEEILERLEGFAAQIRDLGLEKGVGEEKPRERLPSTSLIVEEVYGRNDDMDAVMKLLMSDDVGTDKKICVIPIVGMGGVGKTTLAQALFNDNKVKEMFDSKVWVCVSDHFDACKLTETILKAVTSERCSGTDLNSFQVMLKEKLTGKKFLIVLDDVWEHKYVEWQDLMKPFEDGAQGSKIIVTTRIREVARAVGTVEPHDLWKLTDEECWQLFARHASSGLNGDITLNSELVRYGQEIVKKCNGLPLAAKALGGILRSTSNVRSWKQMAESNIWEFDDKSNILPALKLSYYYLPTPLKRCFVFCSIFPKDYEFQRDELVQLWMGEELVKTSEGKRSMEEVGEGYFNDLVSLSFFQQLKTNRNASYFVMHDLMVDLAKSVSGKYFNLLSDESGTTETRHLAYDIREWHDPDDKRFNKVFEATRLRTFLSVGNNWPGSFFSKDVVDYLLLKLKRLRVLSFYENRISELPDSIGELKHLRYLDLSFTPIRMLPESVAMLYNLQTLKLNCCRSLEMLPKDMHHLIKLRYLDIRDCYSLVEMPSHLSRLKSLQMLSIFIVGKDRGTKMGELRELSGLRGELGVKKLENVVDVKDASNQPRLMDKEQLEKLRLEWSIDYSTDDTQYDRDVLENLKPNILLKELRIYSYQGTSFPKWVGDSSFDNIVFVELLRCSHCCTLPPLGQLRCLKTLIISEFDGVETVGTWFYGTSSAIKPFSSLEMLTFRKMRSWKTWESIHVEDGGTFGKLRELEITDCRNLTGELPRFFPSLTKLNIYKCEKFACSLPRMPRLSELEIMGFQSPSHYFGDHSITIGCLEKLQIFDCRKLESLEKLTMDKCDDSFRFFPMDFFPMLKELSIAECKGFESLSMSNGQCQDLTSLSSLRISGCPNFVSFPKGGLPASKLSTLQIDGCYKLKRLPENMHNLLTSLKTLQIRSCPEIEGFPEGGLPVSLSALTISFSFSFLSLHCDKLTASLSNWNLQRLFNLESLTIRSGGQDVEFFPQEGVLPATITYLEVGGFKKLRALNKNGLQQLTSLKQLSIYECCGLQAITEEGFPDSLVTLGVSDCPNLEKISEEGGGFPASLKTLTIFGCNKFPVQGLRHSLEELSINWQDNLQTIPEEEGFLAPLKKLTIFDCPELLKIRVEWLPSLEEMHISDCPKLQITPEEGFLASLKKLSFNSCRELLKIRVECLPSLEEMWIFGCPKLQITQEEGFPSSLKKLTILDCRELLKIRVECLLSLEKMWIRDCPKLQITPEEGFPASLKQLIIKKCPLVENFCSPENAEYWSKIHRIPFILINDKGI